MVCSIEILLCTKNHEVHKQQTKVIFAHQISHKKKPIFLFKFIFKVSSLDYSSKLTLNMTKFPYAFLNRTQNFNIIYHQIGSIYRHFVSTMRNHLSFIYGGYYIHSLLQQNTTACITIMYATKHTQANALFTTTHRRETHLNGKN